MPLPKRDEDNGKLPSYAWPGGYPIFYVTADNAVLCDECANGENGSEANERHEEKMWRLVDADINYEDDTLYCDHCNTLIECAYPTGDDDSLRTAERHAKRLIDQDFASKTVILNGDEVIATKRRIT